MFNFIQGHQRERSASGGLTQAYIEYFESASGG